MLEAKQITMQFGGLKAVENFNLQLKPLEIVGLIGPNGAGKTTVFNMLTGVYRPTSGKITIANEDTKHIQQHDFCRKGLARTFQNIRLFKGLSVIENVIIAAKLRSQATLFGSIFLTHSYQKEEMRLREKAMNLLKVMELDEFAEMPSGALPYGKARKLEIARALATEPKILLLDEPAAGMNDSETESLTKAISQLRDHFKVSVLVIEHDMKLVMRLCERIIVLDHGVTIAQGLPKEIQKNPHVIAAYLGAEDSE